jgi:predicted porin
MGLLPNAGAMGQGNRAFGRQSWVGLSGPWGSASLGRQYTMLFWSLLDADVIGPNIHSMSNIDLYIPNARADNSIAYKGKFDGITVGATYSFGRDVVNAGPSPAGTNCAGQSAADHKACREWSALLKYDAPAWGVAAAVDELRGGPGAFGGLTSSSLTDRRATLNGYVRIARAKIAGGLLRRNNEGSPATPRSDMWFAGISYPVTSNVIVDAQFIRYDTKASPNDANFVVARATYALSKRTAVYASASHIANKGAANFSTSGGLAGGNPPAGAGQSGIALGVRHVF